MSVEANFARLKAVTPEQRLAHVRRERPDLDAMPTTELLDDLAQTLGSKAGEMAAEVFAVARAIADMPGDVGVHAARAFLRSVIQCLTEGLEELR